MNADNCKKSKYSTLTVLSCVKQTNNEKFPCQSVSIISVPLNRWSKRYDIFSFLEISSVHISKTKKITTLRSLACHLDPLLSLI